MKKKNDFLMEIEAKDKRIAELEGLLRRAKSTIRDKVYVINVRKDLDEVNKLLTDIDRVLNP